MKLKKLRKIFFQGKAEKNENFYVPGGQYAKSIKRILHGTEDSHIIPLLYQIKKESNMLSDPMEAYTVYMLAKSTAKIAGDIAEVGVYRGGSARAICEAKKNRPLHLFDTFDGLPEPSEEKDNHEKFYAGRFDASMESVRDYLKSYSSVYLYKGIFPETAGVIADKKFSFVNLDLDIYESTRAALEFFYPRMNKGGMILSHDYPTATGVKLAIDDFFSDKPESVIQILPRQALIVKL